MWNYEWKWHPGWTLKDLDWYPKCSTWSSQEGVGGHMAHISNSSFQALEVSLPPLFATLFAADKSGSGAPKENFGSSFQALEDLGGLEAWRT